MNTLFPQNEALYLSGRAPFLNQNREFMVRSTTVFEACRFFGSGFPILASQAIGPLQLVHVKREILETY